MEESIYIAANNTEDQLAHQVKVEFVSDDISQVNSFSFIQPTCFEPEEVEEEVGEEETVEEEESNTTSYNMVVDIK